MSAIVGIYGLDGRPVDGSDVEAMLTRLAHRGPHGAETWRDGPIGLGHRKLWTTPESLHERLPLADTASRLVLTADARIDNRDELIAALGLSGRIKEPITDALLILSAYEKWGVACPEKLVGDFAFAIWDGRRQQLFCARDPVGVKAFYYYHSARSFVFATEIKALFCAPDVPRQLNEERIADLLATNFEDTAITCYRRILRLPPAHSLVVRRETIRLRRYWSFDPTYELRLSSNQAYAEAFREQFTEAVRCRLRSALPVASTLSGGLDSSSIACTARELLAAEGRPRLHTFSAIFPGLPEEDLPHIDERRYVRAVLAKGGFEAHCVRADRLGPIAELDRFLWHQDEPLLAPNLYIHWALYRAAQAQGARVFLDGLDGDTTVSHGFERLMELAYRGRWIRLVKEARALSRLSPVAAYTPRRIIWQFGFRPLIPDVVTQLWRWARQSPPPWASTINPAFAQRIELAKRMASLNKRPCRRQTARQLHCEDLTAGLLPYTLEIADKAAAAFALEARYPFFDRRLMEFCLALPAEQQLHQGWTRVIMRRAMTDTLPTEVQWRKNKANLSLNFKRRLFDEGRETLEQAILQASPRLAAYMDMAVLRDVYHRYASEPIRHGQEGLIVYGAVVLARWLHKWP